MPQNWRLICDAFSRWCAAPRPARRIDRLVLRAGERSMICIVTIETPVNIRRTGIATNRASGEHRRKPLRVRERRRTGRGERGIAGETRIAGTEPFVESFEGTQQ